MIKRSIINTYIQESIDFFHLNNFYLPKWGYWNYDEWKKNLNKSEEIFSNQLGWDITDFGSGVFEKRGLILFTIRNGNPSEKGKTYCEKIMIVGEEQETPLHYHFSKMEDIINRGGGLLIMELYNTTESG